MFIMIFDIMGCNRDMKGRLMLVKQCHKPPLF